MLTKIIQRGLFGILCESFSITAENLGYWLMLLLAVALSVASGYLLGSINSAIIISTKKFGSDIRNHGSGNAGTTNTLRTYGKKMAAEAAISYTLLSGLT